jgi:hypothetical protein
MDTLGHNRLYPMQAVYPYNHVFESESGHIMEIDDTKDNERLFTHIEQAPHMR